MKAILRRWTLLRMLRLILGIAILVQGIASKDAITILLGLMFAGMAIANLGCCGVNGCEVRSAPGDKTKRIHYEELDTKK